MKKKKLNLKKITVSNLDLSLSSRIKGGVTVVHCTNWTQDPFICDDGGSATCPGGACGQSRMATCEIFCTSRQENTCNPCTP
ncbi:MAG: hypothetical protein GY755_23260 [Chloroflexi bacterium]|nr:hypothetical protein [Chloroflexota bacterium]